MWISLLQGQHVVLQRARWRRDAVVTAGQPSPLPAEQLAGFIGSPNTLLSALVAVRRFCINQCWKAWGSLACSFPNDMCPFDL